jgi:predicted SprT family Zn-dependent metalloprotease
MEEKLQELYNDCIKELATIKIDIINNPLIGEIDIKLAPRNSKRYGCCKQENPDIKSAYIVQKGKNVNIKYDRYCKHHIEISKWVMNLDNSIIKNTIMHEIIHCFPGCNNHGKTFKDYASYINEKLGYNITRLGNKEADFQKSNLDFEKESNSYNYKIVCQQCGEIFYRKRLKKNFIRKYRCGKCGGQLQLNQ